MDELPSEAKRVLELAKGAQEGADLATRRQVRARVEAAVAAAGLAQGGHSSTASGKELGRARSFLTTTKVMIASGALLFGAGTALWGTSRQVASHSEAPAAEEAAPAPPTSKAPEATEFAQPAALDVTETTATASASREARKTRTPVGTGEGTQGHALAAEMSLLSQAADALANRDLGKARTVLSEHRQRFARPQLREEREGLLVLARCMERPEGAYSDALSFVRKSPASMLAARIKQACGLRDGT
jgi:hypothetical protein